MCHVVPSKCSISPEAVLPPKPSPTAHTSVEDTAATADRKRGARVIALASITGVYAEPGLAVYGASKAALISLMETLNAEESANGVMATAIAPAYVATDMSAWTADTIPANDAAIQSANCPKSRTADARRFPFDPSRFRPD